MSTTHDDLVVDDDRAVGKSFGHAPTAGGRTVFTAPDAAIALERLRENEVGTRVTDIRLPGTDGIEPADALKAGQPRASALSVADCDNACCAARAHAAGVDALVRKPQSPELIEVSSAKAIVVVRPMPVAAAALAGPAAADAPAAEEGGRIDDDPHTSRHAGAAHVHEQFQHRQRHRAGRTDRVGDRRHGFVRGFDDQPLDVEAARAAGWGALHFTDPAATGRTIREAGGWPG